MSMAQLISWLELQVSYSQTGSRVPPGTPLATQVVVSLLVPDFVRG
jgi:hypothetical protein